MEIFMISIIVPVYQAEKSLKNCIESVLSQTYQSIELILVDDGSHDDSGKICDEFKKKDSRVKVIHKKNGGVSSARNAGLSIAKGEYIEFMDADDKLDPNACEKLTEIIVSHDWDFVVFGHKVFKDVKYITSKGIDREYCTKTELMEDFVRLYEKQLLNPPWNKLYRKTIIDEKKIVFDKDISLGEDVIFNLEYMKYIHNAKFISDDFYLYNAKSGGLSTKYNRTTIDSIIKRYKILFHLINDRHDDIWKEELKIILLKELKYFYRLMGLQNGISRIVDELCKTDKKIDLLLEYFEIKNAPLVISMAIYPNKFIGGIGIFLYAFPYRILKILRDLRTIIW